MPANIKRDEEGFTEMQRAFLEHYLHGDDGAESGHRVRGHATHAATAAGYSPRTAYAIGSELTKKPHIRAKIEAHRRRERERWLKRWLKR